MDNKFLSNISSGAYLRKFGTWYNALDSFVKYINDSECETSDFLSVVKGQTLLSTGQKENQVIG